MAVGVEFVFSCCGDSWREQQKRRNRLVYGAASQLDGHWLDTEPAHWSSRRVSVLRLGCCRFHLWPGHTNDYKKKWYPLPPCFAPSILGLHLGGLRHPRVPSLGEQSHILKDVTISGTLTDCWWNSETNWPATVVTIPSHYGRIWVSLHLPVWF